MYFKPAILMVLSQVTKESKVHMTISFKGMRTKLFHQTYSCLPSFWYPINSPFTRETDYIKAAWQPAHLHVPHRQGFHTRLSKPCNPP